MKNRIESPPLYFQIEYFVLHPHIVSQCTTLHYKLNGGTSRRVDMCIVVSKFHAHPIPLSVCVSQLYQQGRLCQLGGEFCELEVFAKVLRASDKR